jgi:hypothetical protein
MDIAPIVQELICLAPMDHEKDPEIESKWTHDPDYLRMLSTKPARPLSPAQVKKKYEAIEKEMEESHNSFYFTIRTHPDDRLVGFIKIYWVEWTNGNGWVELGIGDPNDRGLSWELSRYYVTPSAANLYCPSAVVPETTSPRAPVYHGGFRKKYAAEKLFSVMGYGMLHLGLLREEWEAQVKGT